MAAMQLATAAVAPDTRSAGGAKGLTLRGDAASPNWWGWGRSSASGITVSPDSAQYLVPVTAAISVLSEGIAAAPFITYQRRADGGRERAPNHPLYALLHDAPNPELTAFEYWELVVGHTVAWGNHYSVIERDRTGTALALWPLRCDRMTIARTQTGDLRYIYHRPDTGEAQLFLPRDVLHIRDRTRDGVTGISRIAQARETIGLATATEQFGARFFGNDSRPGGLLSVDGKLSDEAASRLKVQWEAMHAGDQNRWRVAVLENGVTWQTIGVPPEDSQFLETRNYQRTEIASIFRVPPHMIGDLGRATWANIEHQAIEFATYALRPWMIRIEQAVRRSLFVEPGPYYAEFLLDSLLRGDAMTRSQALAIQRQNGIITANEWRELENRNRIDGGDALLVNGNMIPVVQAAEPTPAAVPVALTSEPAAPVEERA
jgi:HK97 family phage portal protein